MKGLGNLSFRSLNGPKGLTLNAFYGDMKTSGFSDLSPLKGR